MPAAERDAVENKIVTRQREEDLPESQIKQMALNRKAPIKNHEELHKKFKKKGVQESNNRDIFGNDPLKILATLASNSFHRFFR